MWIESDWEKVVGNSHTHVKTALKLTGDFNAGCNF